MQVPRLEHSSIVILNWQTADLTIRCTRALIDDGVPPGRIAVVDNGSRDDSADRIEAEFPDCVLVRLDENIGYARAANAGARRLPGEAYLVMNNDAFVHRPGSVQALFDAFRDETVGMVVPRLLNSDLSLQPSVRPLPTPAVSVVLAAGIGRLLPNDVQPRWSHHWDHAESRAIEAANGAVLLVRGTTWDQLGGYNERRPMYAEDSDLCWRTRKLGWKIWFAGTSEFVHLGNATGSRFWTDERRAEIIGREEAKLLREQLSPAGAAVSFGSTWLYLTWRRALFAARGDRPAAAATRAARSGYREGWRASAGGAAG